MLFRSHAKHVLARPEYIQRIAAPCAASSIYIIQLDTDTADSRFYEAVRACEPFAYPTAHEDMRWDDCLMVYTSGTTGNPKGVVLIQQNLFSDCGDIAAWHGITTDQRMMCVLPVHHVNGTIVTHATPFLAGASVVLHRKFSPRTFFATIREECVNVVSVVPTLLAFLLEAGADAAGCHEIGRAHV